MAVLFAGCPQPSKGNCDLNDPAGCLCRTYAEAKRRCVEKGEGWRWGVGERS